MWQNRKGQNAFWILFYEFAAFVCVQGVVASPTDEGSSVPSVLVPHVRVPHQ